MRNLFRSLPAALLLAGWATFACAQDATHNSSSTADTTTISFKHGKAIIIIDKKDSSGQWATSSVSVDTSAVSLKKKKRPNGRSRRDTGLRIDLGVNGLLNSQGSTNLPADLAFLEQRYGKSIGLNLTQLYGIPLIKSNVLLMYGFGFELNNFRLQQNSTPTVVNDKLVALDLPSTVGTFHKNKLSANYVHLPLMLELKTNQTDRHKNFKAAFGVEGALLLNDHMKQVMVSAATGERIKSKSYADLNVEPFKVSAIARLNYGSYGLFARYGLTDMFSGQNSSVYPFFVGVTLTTL